MSRMQPGHNRLIKRQHRLPDEIFGNGQSFAQDQTKLAGLPGLGSMRWLQDQESSEGWYIAGLLTVG